jgi:hypothetical protein
VCEVLFLCSRFGFGGVCAGGCDPVVDECEEPLKAVGGQRAGRDFRSQAGYVRFAVQARMARACSPAASRVRYCWRLYGGVRHIVLTRTSRAGGPPCCSYGMWTRSLTVD